MASIKKKKCIVSFRLGRVGQIRLGKIRSYVSLRTLRGGTQTLTITSRKHQTELIIIVFGDLWNYWAVLMSLLHFAAIL